LSTKIYCKFTAESACERILRSVNIWLSYGQESSLPQALSVWALLLKDEELDRYLEYDKKQLLLAVFTLIFSKRELYMLSPVRLSSVCRLSVVCNVRAPYSGGSNFRQYF